MTDVENDMLKNLLKLLAKRIENLDETIRHFEHALRWFDKTEKEVHD